MLIKMIDGGILDYADDHYHYDGCPTCNFGVFMTNNVHDYYVDLIANLNKEVKDLKEKH